MLFCMVIILLDFDHNSPRIDQPNQGNQKRGKDDHHSLVLDHTKIVSINVVISKCFNQNSHNCSRKEHAK